MSRDYTMFIKPEIIHNFVTSCSDIGHKVIITSVDRDYKEQYALFCQGREPLETVNRFRKIAGLPPIKQAENQRKVTWTLNSKHIINLEDEKLDNDKSLAFDFALLYNDKSVNWNVKADVDNDQIPDYLECALVGESLGLYSGRHFKNPDYPHLQIGT
jgi:hypothetical protein